MLTPRFILRYLLSRYAAPPYMIYTAMPYFFLLFILLICLLMLYVSSSLAFLSFFFFFLTMSEVTIADIFTAFLLRLMRGDDDMPARSFFSSRALITPRGRHVEQKMLPARYCLHVRHGPCDEQPLRYFRCRCPRPLSPAAIVTSCCHYATTTPPALTHACPPSSSLILLFSSYDMLSFHPRDASDRYFSSAIYV